MKAISRTEAVDYANIVLESTEANSSERRLARYVLAMETLVASFVQDAEQATPAAPAIALDAPCSVCGWRVMDAADLAEVMQRHDQLVQSGLIKPHAASLEQAPGRYLVLTEGTIREIERPSGEIADRDSTGGNDPYSNS